MSGTRAKGGKGLCTERSSLPCLQLEDRRILVVGFARTGLSVIRHLVSRGARVKVYDTRCGDRFSELLAALPASVEGLFETAPSSLLEDVEFVVTSPGVPVEAEVLQEAVRRGLPVWSEIELAYRQLGKPILAVTGTNGKSTTVSLLGEIVKQGGLRPFVGGNLGYPLIEAAQGTYDLAVAEVSSFQLEWIDRFRPSVGVILNIAEDHMDRHHSLGEYASTKMGMFRNQRADDLAVLSRDDDLVWNQADRVASEVVSFGLDPVETGAFVVGNELVLRWRGSEEHYPLSRTRLRGDHNRRNAMAAVLAARAVGVGPEAVQKGLESFRGLEHRMEFVCALGGVTYINDSKATNVDAVAQALASCSQPVILLAGGSNKGVDFKPLRELARQRVKLLILFGQARPEMAAALSGAVPIEMVADLATAVPLAARAAAAGETVLLSPACASFDQFQDYAERGRQFKELVSRL